ncbi:MAG: deoxyribonuclease IV, partial [Muribaculaceae bacterium]|nr:deoxyribonuclease IV [Muribaculaceae bacterium]
MKYIGAHVSVAGGVENAPSRAHAIGAKAFALFTGSSNRWVSKEISDKQAELFKNACEEFGYSPDVILPHDNFLINLGSPDTQKLA